MEDIDSTERLKIGDTVTTAGIDLGGGVRSPFPKGILVGLDRRRRAGRERGHPDGVRPAGRRPRPARVPPGDHRLPRWPAAGRSAADPVRVRRDPARGRAAVREPHGQAVIGRPGPRSRRPADARTALVGYAAMKGIVLAGGTATRLFPLTIVTNKHLLPIYDRPMIYYPIETLASMGIREVMVIVGGKSVGDVVELLADGLPLRAGPDLPLPARGAGHRPCHRAGPRLRRRRGVLLRPRRQHPARRAAGPGRRRVRGRRRGAPGRCSTGSRIPSGSGSPSSTRPARSSASRRSPTVPKSDLIPIGVYFLRPDAFEVIDRLAPSGRGEFEITDVLNHYIPNGGLFTRVYDGHWTDAGTVPSPPPLRRDGRLGRRRGPARPAAAATRVSAGAASGPGSRRGPSRVAGSWSPAEPGSSARASSGTSSLDGTGPGSSCSTSSPTPGTRRTCDRSSRTPSRRPG